MNTEFEISVYTYIEITVYTYIGQIIVNYRHLFKLAWSTALYMGLITYI